MTDLKAMVMRICVDERSQNDLHTTDVHAKAKNNRAKAEK